MAALVDADVAELMQRVQAAAHRCARKPGGQRERADRAPAGTAGERPDDGKPARERGHEVRIAGEATELRHDRSRPTAWCGAGYGNVA